MRKFKLESTNRFNKSLMQAKKRGLSINELSIVVDKLANDIPLEFKYKDHRLKGEWKGYRECHIQPDWLLIYTKDKDKLVLTLIDTGSHSDIFN